jgi:lysophospholipase L1-like esterase
MACAGAIAASGLVHAELVQMNGASRSETAFIASNIDLINKGAASLVSATHSGYTPYSSGGRAATNAANLNDGALGLPYTGYGAAALSTVSYDSDGRWSSTYRLNTTTNATGYDISGIRTVSGAPSVARNQRFELLFSTVDSPETFTSYGTYSHAPGGFGGARITLTGSGGAIAKNVAAVRFSVDQAEGVATVYREFDVFGAPTGSGHPSAFQRVTPDDSRITYSDYARLVRLDASEARFDRPLAGVRGGRENANPAARVRFRTDATMITASFTTGTLATTQGTGVILVDGVRAGTFDASVSGSMLEVDVPIPGAGYRDIELLLPYSQDVRFTGLLVNGEAGFQSPTVRSPIRYVAYGDSITQGFWSSDAYSNYSSLVGKQNDWEVVNMGFGSRGLKDSGSGGADGAVVASLGADVISVMMGANDAAAQVSANTYRALMEAFVARIREVDGTVPIYLISPLYTSNAAIQPRLLEYRNQITGLVNDSPDSNLHWIDGLSLGIDATNVGSLTSDGIHPNDTGFSLLASNLAPQMSPSSRLQGFGLTLGSLSPQTLSIAGASSIQVRVVPEPAAIVMVVVSAILLLPRCTRRSS